MSVEIDGVNNIIKADTISEVTSANGVSIDSLAIKDGKITNLMNATLSAADLGTGLHVKTADSGATVNAAADELVIEASGNGGMTILNGTSSAGAIHFRDSGNNAIGYIAYQHNNNHMVFGVNNTEVVNIHDNGVAAFNNGVALGVGTANTASNVLGDYEEGTWTIPNGAVNGITYAVASSLGVTYTKVGRNVTVFGQVVFGASTSDNNATYFGTLPFTSASNGVFVGKVQTTADITGACVELNGGENFLRLMKDSGGSYDYITRAESRNETFAFTITYHV